MNTWLKLLKLYKNCNWWRKWLRATIRAWRGRHLFKQYLAKDSTLSGLWFPGPLPSDKAFFVRMLTHTRQVLTDLGHVFSDIPFTITFWAGSPAITDVSSHQILIDASLFLAPPQAMTERIDIAGGLVIHELSHLEFSEPNYLKRAHKRSRLFYIVWGTIEDERIERLAIKRAPGFADLLRKVRRFYLTPNADEIISLSKQEWEQLLTMVFLAIRNPSAISKTAIERFKEELNFVVNVLSPFPLTPQGAYQAAERIVEHLFSEQEEAEKKERLAGEHGKGGIGDGSENSDQDQPPSLEKWLENLLAHSPPSRAPTSLPVLTKALSELEQAGAKMRPGYRGKIGSGGFGTPPSSELDLSGPIFFKDATEDAAAYAKALNSVRALIVPLRRYFQYHAAKQRKQLIKGVPAGRLAGRILYRVSSSTDLFAQTRRQENKQKIVVLLIDHLGINRLSYFDTILHLIRIQNA